MSEASRPTSRALALKILLAIDGSECSEAATQAVIAQLRPQHTDVHVIHAVDWEHVIPISLQFERGSAVAQGYQRLRDRTVGDANALVARTARQLQDAGFWTSPVVQEGEPRRVILDYAVAWAAELIVVGSHGKTGLDRLLLGSVSEHIARHATCSVEIVRAANENPRPGGLS
jgi:nucleotide-binding universal stress UspA family protein